MPTEVEVKREWINAINKINDESCKCNGSGFICSLHFDVKSIKNIRGNPQLEKGAIPVKFEYTNSQSTVRENETNSVKNSTELDVLNSEIHELKRILFKERMDRELEIRRKNDRIEALAQQCKDLTIKSKSLEKLCSTLDSQGKKSRDRLLQYINATDMNVNYYNIFIFMSFFYLFVCINCRTFAKKIS